jgi:hypothetical protein
MSLANMNRSEKCCCVDGVITVTGVCLLMEIEHRQLQGTENPKPSR